MKIDGLIYVNFTNLILKLFNYNILIFIFYYYNKKGDDNFD